MPSSVASFDKLNNGEGETARAEQRSAPHNFITRGLKRRFKLLGQYHSGVSCLQSPCTLCPLSCKCYYRQVRSPPPMTRCRRHLWQLCKKPVVRIGSVWCWYTGRQHNLKAQIARHCCHGAKCEGARSLSDGARNRARVSCVREPPSGEESGDVVRGHTKDPLASYQMERACVLCLHRPERAS